jgi:hypothetical protein
MWSIDMSLKLTVSLVAALCCSQAVYADWLLEGGTPPPLEDIKGEVGSDMKFGFAKGLFAPAVKLLTDGAATNRIEDSESGRSSTAVAVGEYSAMFTVAAIAKKLPAIKGSKLPVRPSKESQDSWRTARIEYDISQIKDELTILRIEKVDKQ